MSATSLSGTAPAQRRHWQIFNRRQTGPVSRIDHDADWDLPVGQRKFGCVLVDVALRSDPDRLAERGRRHAQFGSERQPRLDDDFWTLQITIDPGRTQLFQLTHFFDQFVSRFGDECWIRPCKHDCYVASQTTILTLERHPGIGNRA
jgi:hypothetical protein